jgi:hypothetical protein
VLKDTGWSPAEITLRLKDGPFDAAEILADPETPAAFNEDEEIRKLAGKGTALKDPNNPKYTIVDQSSPFHDVNNLVVTVQRTDYFTVVRASPGIAKSSEARIRYGHIDGSKSRIPQATAIQFSAIFADDQILALQRAKDAFRFPGAWSFSAEEQMAEIDLAWPEQIRMENFLLRTAVEEIFPLGQMPKPELLASAMAYIRPHILSMQTWSLIIEDPTSTLQFFSVFELGLTTAQYKTLVRDIVQSGMGQASHEGRYFAVSLRDIEPLLSGSSIKATQLFGEDQEEILPSLLHPTSRYRLLRLLDWGV